MAAHYSPNPKSQEMGVDLPFDLNNGEMLQNVWNRWLSWDPVRMVEKYSNNLKKLKLIYIDCGTKDEFNLHWGSRILHSKLKKMNIRHVYEEFDDGHMNISYRYDVSLPKIYSHYHETVVSSTLTVYELRSVVHTVASDLRNK
jgi:S-formylglutathione hydrolase FrmB